MQAKQLAHDHPARFFGVMTLAWIVGWTAVSVAAFDSLHLVEGLILSAAMSALLTWSLRTDSTRPTPPTARAGVALLTCADANFDCGFGRGGFGDGGDRAPS
jgi:hypothetical protein